MPTARTETQPLVAVIDDDVELRTSLSALLEENGFACLAVSGGRDFFAHEASGFIALEIVDLRLEGESGLAVSKPTIRARHDLPIIMLTGASTDVDKIVGLETGGDDYITKPFNPRELVARVRAVLRRYGHSITATAKANRAAIAFGRLRLDLVGRALHTDAGAEISLTNAEHRLLEFFLQHPNTVIPRVQLLAEMGSDHSQYVDRTIDVLILRLRCKIEAVPSKPVHLQTRRGQGYIFVRAPTPDPLPWR